MASSTLVRDALRWELPRLLPELDYSQTRIKNTDSVGSVPPESWEPWLEFRRDILCRIFSRELNRPYRGPRPQHPLNIDRCISSEDTVTAAYYYFVWPIVNNSLNSQHGQPHYSAGSRYGQAADWLCVRGTDKAIRLAGDTKIDYKWNPGMLDSLSGDFGDQQYMAMHDEWEKVVGQIQGYAVANATRYAICVTDGGVTVLRLRKTRIPQSEVVTRAQNTAPRYTGHQRGLSDLSMATTSTAATLSSGSQFEGEATGNKAYEIPQFAFIPWDGSGDNGLSLCEACFFLALMAVNGENGLSYSYPALDSYRLCVDGSFIHNTSGRLEKKLPSGSIHEEPETTINEAESAMPVENFDFADEPHEEDGTYEDYELQYSPPSVAENLINNYSEASSTHPGETTSSGKGKGVEMQRKTVAIKKHTFGRGLYFVTPNGTRIETERSRWTRLLDGYEMRTKNHIYFTKTMPPK